MSLKETAAEAKRGEDVLVSPLHAQWLLLPDEKKVYSDKALQFVLESLAGDLERPAERRIRPSSLHCPRYALFSYGGAPQAEDDLDLSEMSELGNWGHLRWQAEGLSFPPENPWLVSAEEYLADESLNLGGSIDGRCRDGRIFDAKTRGYNYYKVLSDGMPDKHVIQMDCYLLLADADKASVVYEDRSTGRWHEIVHHRDIRREASLIRLLGVLDHHIEADTLAEMIEPCASDRSSYTYRSCRYRKHCPGALTLSNGG